MTTAYVAMVQEALEPAVVSTARARGRPRDTLHLS